MTLDQLKELFSRQNLVTPGEQEKLAMKLIKGDVARRQDKLSQRYVVSIGDKPRYMVKFIPTSWSFSPEDILATISQYSQFTSIKVPKLLAHFKTADGYYFVDEFLESAVSLDVLIERGSIGSAQALELLRSVFSEVFNSGQKASVEFLKAEKQSYLRNIKKLVHEGIWGDFILHYVDKTIDDNVELLKEVRVSGDIIDRNFLLSNGQWYLIDYEYSHRTIFGFKEAYRNILYTSWARNYTLADLYPPLRNFPQDVAAMLSVAWDREFQADVLEEHAREITQKHLRFVFWNLLDPAIMTRLDRHTASLESLMTAKDAELGKLRNELAETAQNYVRANEKLEHLHSLVGQQKKKIEELSNDLQRQVTTILEKDRRMREIEAWGQEMSELSKQKESTIAYQQKSIEELSARERNLSSRLAEKESALEQKSNEFIYIKSTLSYSVGRIIVFPFELLFNFLVRVFRILDRKIGRILWPHGTKRAMIVNAMVNLKQTIATATYLLHMHGIKGFTGGVKQTWKSGVNLGLHRSFTVKSSPTSSPEIRRHSRALQRMKQIIQMNVGISIVIPAYNGSEDLVKLLPAIRAQKGIANIEIVIVDSGSTDDTVEMAREFGAMVITISQEEFSHSHSRNLGARHATQDYLLFMVQDALPPSEIWLHEMMTAMQELKVSAASCVEIPRSDADLFTRVQQWYHYKIFLSATTGDRVSSMPAERDPVTLRKHAQLSDVACLMSKATWKQYGFRHEYGEDLDLGIRLLTDGHKIAVLSSTKIIHSHNRSTYSHLKRGYVDKLVLAKILNEAASSHVKNIGSVYSDILFASCVLGKLDFKKMLGSKGFCSVGEMQSLIEREFGILSKTSMPPDFRLIRSEFVDERFETFLAAIHSKYGKLKNPPRPEGLILNGILEFLAITFRYMRETYDVIDEYILRDLQSLIYKHYANLAGVYIAISVRSSKNGSSRELAELHRELSDGKIDWEVNNNQLSR